jgi:hypothetical protein
MKLVSRATEYTLSRVSFPHSKLDWRGYHSTTLNVSLWWFVKLLISFNSDEPVLKYLSVLIAFSPRIDEMKDAIVRPDSRLDLFVNSHPLWWAFSDFVRLSRFVEFAILSQPARRKSFWLIRRLWIRVLWSPWLIMAFVH